jgi:hypothetical protein
MWGKYMATSDTLTKHKFHKTERCVIAVGYLSKCEKQNSGTIVHFFGECLE